MAFKVLIPQDVHEAGKKYLKERGYEIKMGSGISVDILKEEVKNCDAILARTARYPAEVLKAGKRLKVIARYGVGVDNIDVKAATELGIYVVNTPIANANTVAEHTIGLVMVLAKHLVRCDKEFRDGNYEIRNQLSGIDLEGKILGVIGLGRIGTLVAKKAAGGFDMKVIGYDPYVNRENLAPEIELINDWDYVFKNSDFISIHLPSNSKTKAIVGKKEFQMMKKTSYFINVARGEIINELDLIEALQKKEIAGAGLDVFEQEPPDKDNPLFKMENVILTPHNAALSKEAIKKMSLHAAMGIHEVLSGKEPGWPVNNPKKD